MPYSNNTVLQATVTRYGSHVTVSCCSHATQSMSSSEMNVECWDDLEFTAHKYPLGAIVCVPLTTENPYPTVRTDLAI